VSRARGGVLGAWCLTACGLAGAGLQAGVGWYNVGKRAGDYGSNGGTTDKRGGMCRKRKRKTGYTITEILVA
jgi:hypothetical protein